MRTLRGMLIKNNPSFSIRPRRSHLSYVPILLHNPRHYPNYGGNLYFPGTDFHLLFYDSNQKSKFCPGSRVFQSLRNFLIGSVRCCPFAYSCVQFRKLLLQPKQNEPSLNKWPIGKINGTQYFISHPFFRVKESQLFSKQVFSFHVAFSSVDFWQL